MGHFEMEWLIFSTKIADHIYFVIISIKKDGQLTTSDFLNKRCFRMVLCLHFNRFGQSTTHFIKTAFLIEQVSDYRDV